MNRRLMVLMSLGLCAAVVMAGSTKREQTETIRVVAGDSTTVDTFATLTLRHGGNTVVGRIIIEPSTYTTGSYGILDTAEIIVKAAYYDGTTLIEARTLDSVKQTGVNALPCTLLVNTFDDSTLSMDRLYIYLQVRDTVAVAAGSTATYPVQINLLHLWTD